MHIENSAPVSIAYPDVFYATPLVASLHQRNDLTLNPCSPNDVFPETDTAQHGCILLPPTALLHHGPYRILPGVGIIADGTSPSERLVADQPLESIKQIAVDPAAQHLIPLLSLIFLERGLPLPIVVAGDDHATLPLLLSGNAGLARAEDGGHDLGALWQELTDLPLVLGLWACGPGAPYRKLRTLLGEAARDAEASCTDRSWPAHGLHYRLLSKESDSLRTFYSLAVKHGLTVASEEAIVFC